MPAVVLRPTHFADNLRERPDALWGFLAVIVGIGLTTIFIYPLNELDDDVLGLGDGCYLAALESI